MISMNLSKSRKRFEKKHHLKDNRLYEFFTMFATFFIVCIGLILFRAESIGQAWEYFQGMMQSDTLMACYRFFKRPALWPTNLFIVIMLAVEWLQRRKEHGFDIANLKPLTRYALVVLLIEFVLFFMATTPSQFIYFQF